MRTAWLLAVFVLLFLVLAISASRAAVDVPRNTSLDTVYARDSIEPGQLGATLAQDAAARFESVVGVVGVIHAASCSQEDVQAAIDAANDGDTVSVPAGTCTWTTPLDGGGYTHDPAVLIHLLLYNGQYSADEIR
jgi:polygalacturonase